MLGGGYDRDNLLVLGENRGRALMIEFGSSLAMGFLPELGGAVSAFSFVHPRVPSGS